MRRIMRFRRCTLPLTFVAGLAVACGNEGSAPKKDSSPRDATSTASAPVANAKAPSPRGLPKGHPPTTGPKPGDIEPPKDLKQPPPEAKKTESGLVTMVLAKGDGDTKPAPHDKVEVHYTGWQKSDGKMFDSSVKRGRPTTFQVSGVIKGWTEALQLMVAGEKRRVWIPSELAYGDKAMRRGMPTGDLVFDVELLKVVPGPKPPETPTDLEKPPADAKKTSSGLVYKRLEKGTGKDHPLPADTVTVHYSGWTKDGEMFDSSVTRERPASFPLGNVIKGWTEGLQLMVEGEKFRFWIPADLAYGDTPKRSGAPAGDLVFDVELLKIRSSPGGMSSPH